MPARRSPSRPLLRLATRVRARGPGEVARLGLTRLREWPSSHGSLVMFVKEVDDTSASYDHVREASPEDADAFARDIGTESPATFRARLSHTTRCWLVVEGARLLHASWVTLEGAWTRELRRWIAPPSGDAYIYESFTRADARGRGAYPRVLAGIAAWAARSGLRRLWVAVEADNHASLRAVGKAGFSPAFTIDFHRRWGRVVVTRLAGALDDTGRQMIRPQPPGRSAPT